MSDRDHAIPPWILEISSACNLAMSKVTPVILRGTSNLNIIVRLDEDANRLDTPQADIISLLLNWSRPLHSLLQINHNAMDVQSEKKIALYNCMSSSGNMSHCECQAKHLAKCFIFNLLTLAISRFKCLTLKKCKQVPQKTVAFRPI